MKTIQTEKTIRTEDGILITVKLDGEGRAYHVALHAPAEGVLNMSADLVLRAAAALERLGELGQSVCLDHGLRDGYGPCPACPAPAMRPVVAPAREVRVCDATAGQALAEVRS